MITQAVLAFLAVALVLVAIFSALLTGIHMGKGNASEAKFGLFVVFLFLALGMAAAFCA